MKVAVITGASSGLGAEFARQVDRLYRDLDEIWVIARRERRLQEMKKSLKTYVRIFAGDLEDELIYKQVLNRLENQNPEVRLLVNAAGFGKIGSVEEIASKDKSAQLRMIDVNCRALTQMTTVCLPYMTKGSRIINIASAAAFCPQTGFAVYAATKSYVLSFSRGLRAELEDRKISVTAVCPGPVDTEFFEVSGTSDSLMKKAVMVASPQVVRRALSDAKARKELSVYGLPMKAAFAATKLLPHRLIIKFMKS